VQTPQVRPLLDCRRRRCCWCWLRWRAALWLVGVLFAAFIASYWIADEIYPYVLR
jgi:hypothetical protein